MIIVTMTPTGTDNAVKEPLVQTETEEAAQMSSTPGSCKESTSTCQKHVM